MRGNPVSDWSQNRVGERGREARPLVIGVRSEEEKRNILDRAAELRRSSFSNISIGPDMTRMQRRAEDQLAREVETRNNQLTAEDREKNLRWMVVGRRGEKRMIRDRERAAELWQERNATWRLPTKQHESYGAERLQKQDPDWRKTQRIPTTANYSGTAATGSEIQQQCKLYTDTTRPATATENHKLATTPVSPSTAGRSKLQQQQQQQHIEIKHSWAGKLRRRRGCIKHQRRIRHRPQTAKFHQQQRKLHR
jgi:hypothetical protein